jgi:hypothetical protein
LSIRGGSRVVLAESDKPSFRGDPMNGLFPGNPISLVVRATSLAVAMTALAAQSLPTNARADEARVTELPKSLEVKLALSRREREEANQRGFRFSVEGCLRIPGRFLYGGRHTRSLSGLG